MNTFPIMTAESAQIQAFEIEHPYITTRSLARLLTETEGVVDVYPRPHSHDVKVVFTFRSQPFVVWAPHDRDGRYRIAADSGAAGADVAALREAFERYRPSLLRNLYCAFVTSRLFRKSPERNLKAIRIG